MTTPHTAACSWSYLKLFICHFKCFNLHLARQMDPEKEKLQGHSHGSLLDCHQISHNNLTNIWPLFNRRRAMRHQPKTMRLNFRLSISFFVQWTPIVFDNQLSRYVIKDSFVFLISYVLYVEKVMQSWSSTLEFYMTWILDFQNVWQMDFNKLVNYFQPLSIALPFTQREL